jgi:hypothetical protein
VIIPYCVAMRASPEHQHIPATDDAPVGDDGMAVAAGGVDLEQDEPTTGGTNGSAYLWRVR